MILADSLFSVYTMKKISLFSNIAYFGSFIFHIINLMPKFSESNKAQI